MPTTLEIRPYKVATTEKIICTASIARKASEDENMHLNPLPV